MIAAAFLRRDVLNWLSYRLAVFWHILGAILLVVALQLVGSTIDERQTVLSEEEGSYVAFVLSGVAFTDLILQALYAIPQAIRDNQKSGTLEPMLLTPVGTVSIPFFSAIFRFVLASVRLVIYSVFGVIVLGFWHDANPITVTIIVLLAGGVALGIGSISAAFVILVKQGDPMLIGFSLLSSLLSGVLFPVDVLPNWIQPFSLLLPQTYALRGIRDGLDGASLIDVAVPALVLFAMMAVILPIGMFAFRRAIDRAKMEGSLGQY